MVEPSGIRWVGAYSILIALGYGQYGVAFLIKKPAQTEMIVGGSLILLALLFAATTYGLLARKIWAFKLTKTLFSVLMYFEMYRLFKNVTSHDTSTVDTFVQVQAIGFAFWIIAYLKKDGVRAWFKGDKSEAEQGFSEQEQMQEEVARVWKRGIAATLLFTLLFLLVVAHWVSAKISPIPELAEMRVTSGALLKVTSGSTRGAIPFLILKEDSGTISEFGVTRAHIYRPFVGQRVKVWSAERCSLFGASCFESANQVMHMNSYVLDYKDVRVNMEKVRYEVSNFDYFFGGFALTFALLGGLFFSLTKRELKKVKSKFSSIVKGE